MKRKKNLLGFVSMPACCMSAEHNLSLNFIKSNIPGSDRGPQPSAVTHCRLNYIRLGGRDPSFFCPSRPLASPWTCGPKPVWSRAKPLNRNLWVCVGGGGGWGWWRGEGAFITDKTNDAQTDGTRHYYRIQSASSYSSLILDAHRAGLWVVSDLKNK